MKTYTLTVVHEGGGGREGLVETLPCVFVTLQHFEKSLPLIDSFLCRLQDAVNIIEYICKLRCWDSVTSSDMADS